MENLVVEINELLSHPGGILVLILAVVSYMTIIGLLLFVFIGSIIYIIKDEIYLKKEKEKEKEKEKQTPKEDPIYSNFTISKVEEFK